ncbi:hypothetical protein TrST_g8005 [Triparma strigata]|uniref:MIR domain-containing protein n=1 Tax=Triparma strigata TaxID=1606541 RepID=A0A9W7A541_9STRA|nr:hypothetical protein TrST_g8005 [Triparma strigata]
MSSPKRNTPPPPSPRILVGDAPAQRQNLLNFTSRRRSPIASTAPQFQPYLMRSPFLQSVQSREAVLRQKRHQSTRRRLGSEAKDVVGAGLGVVKGVVGTAFGVLGTVVETGAKAIGQNTDGAGPLLPPMTLQGGPMRNIFKNNIISDNLRHHFQKLGIKSPFDVEREKEAKGGVRSKFVPLMSGDIVYLSATVPGPQRSATTLYLSSTGTMNHGLGGLEVQEAEDPEDIYWCLFRVWYRENYSDWHVDERRPCFSVGEHGEYALESLHDMMATLTEDEEVVAGKEDYSGTTQTNNDDEAMYEDMINGPGGRRFITYDKEVVFEHVATGQVLASLNDVGSLVDQDASKICLIDKVQASNGRFKNMVKKEKTQTETFFTVAPRFKSRVAGRVYDGDLVRVNGASSGGRLHFSGSHGVIDSLSRVKVREANLSSFHKVLETQSHVQAEVLKRQQVRKNSHSLASLPSRGETVLSIKRFSKWTPPGTYLHYGDCIRLLNPEIDAYLWCCTGTETPKEAFFRKVRHSSAVQVGGEFDNNVASVITACKSIFMVERMDKLTGGPVRWGETLRLKHLVTGKYLHVAKADDSSQEPEHKTSIFQERVHHQKQKKEYKLTLVDFSSDVVGEPSENELEDEKWIGSLLDFSPVNGRNKTDDQGAAKLQLINAKNCYAVLSHSFVSTSGEVNSDEENAAAADDLNSGTGRCFLHASDRKKETKPVYLHSIFDQRPGAQVQVFSKGEHGNTAEQPRPPASQIGSFTSQFHEKDACKVEVVGWKELQGIMFALSCKKVAQTHMSRVYAFANRRREGEETSFSEESTGSVLKMLHNVRRYASGTAIFPSEIREEQESDGGIHELEIIERKRAAISIIQGTKLLDVLFAMLAAPRHAGLNKKHVTNEDKLAKVHIEIAETIKVATSDVTSQIYVAMQSYQAGPKAGTGYLAELVKQMSWNFGAASLLDSIVTNNKVLTHKLVNEKLVEFFVKSLCEQGPARPTLDFLTSINLCVVSNTGETEPVVQCQETLCKFLFPTFGYDAGQVGLMERRRFNRRQVLIETVLAIDKGVNADFIRDYSVHPSSPNSPHRNKNLSNSPDKHGFQLMVSWEGINDYKAGSAEAKNAHALFYSYTNLFGMKKDAFEAGDPSHNWDISPQSWVEYERTFFQGDNLPKRNWLPLSDFMWTVDPEAHHGTDNWAQMKVEIKSKPSRIQRFMRAQKLASYYLGILHLFTNMCKHRSNRVISHLEKQFSYECLVAGVSDRHLPDVTRSALAELMISLYLDRYPHEALLLPRVVRSYDVKAVQISDDCSKDCDFCLPCFRNDTDGSRLSMGPGKGQPYQEEEEIEVPSINLKSPTSDRDFEGVYFLPNTVMSDKSPDKFKNLQRVIISVLKSSKMIDQLAVRPSNRAEAKHYADRIKLTLSLLSMSKRLLLSGFFPKVELVNELLNHSIRLMHKPSKSEFEEAASSTLGAALGAVGSGLHLGTAVAGGVFGGLCSLLKTQKSDIGIEMKETKNRRSTMAIRNQESMRHISNARNRKAQIDREDAAELIRRFRDGDEEDVIHKIGAELFKFLKKYDEKTRDENSKNNKPASEQKEDEIFERQRQNALGRWSASNIIGNEAKKLDVPTHMSVLMFDTATKIEKAAEIWSIDLAEEKQKHQYSEIGGVTPLLCSKTNPEVDLLPEPTELWEYVEDTWVLSDKVDGVESKDPHKWCYAVKWPQEGENIFGGKKWWPKNGPLSFCRVRKWVRHRARATAVELAIRYSFKLDKISISEAFRKSALQNKTSKGVIDIEIAAKFLSEAVEANKREEANPSGEGKADQASDLNAISDTGEAISTLKSEIAGAVQDTIHCRSYICDMLMYACGVALDVRITTVAGKIKYAIENDVTFYSDGTSVHSSSRASTDSSRSARSESSKKLKKLGSNVVTAGAGELFEEAATSIGQVRVDKSIIGTNLQEDVVVHGILLKHKWAKHSKTSLVLTMDGMDLFDSLFVHSPDDTSMSRFDIGDPSDTLTARTLLGCLVTEKSGLLAEKILCTLFLHHSRKSLLVHRLSELHFLIDDEAFRLHKMILNNLAILRNNVGSFYSWGQGTKAKGEAFFDDILNDDNHRDSMGNMRNSTDAAAFGDMSRNMLKKTLKIIKELTDACYKIKKHKRRMSGMEMHLTSGNNGEKVPAEDRQTMMRKLEVHMVFVELLEIREEFDSDDIGCSIMLKKLQSAGNDFLTAFMDDNEGNKLEVIRTGAIQTFLSHVGKGRGVSRVLASIYKDSPRLVRDVPKSIVVDFATHIHAWREELRNLFFYLDFFRNLLVAGKLPMRRNQKVVMNIFTDTAFSNCLLTYCATGKSGGPSGAKRRGRTIDYGSGIEKKVVLSEPAEERRMLLEEFQRRGGDDSDQKKTFENILLSQAIPPLASNKMSTVERKMYFHARVIELLGLCCTGNVDTTELTAARTVPFNEVYSFFSDDTYAQDTPFLWTAFARFTGNVYFDTDSNSSMSAEGRMHDMTSAWSVVEKISETVNEFTKELRSISEKQQRSPAEPPLSPDSVNFSPELEPSYTVTRRSVLRECVVAGLFAAEAFYRCVVKNYKVESAAYSSAETNKDRLAQTATENLKICLKTLCVDPEFDAGFNSDEKKILNEACLVLSVLGVDEQFTNTDTPDGASTRSNDVKFSASSSTSDHTSDHRGSVQFENNPMPATTDKKKSVKDKKSEFAWSVQSSEYVNKQMIAEFDALTKLVLKFGQEKGSKGGKSAKNKTSKKMGKKKKKKKQAVKIDDMSYSTNPQFDTLIKRLVEHVRRLVAGLIKGQDRYNMSAGEKNGGLLTNCLLGFRSSAPLVLRLLRSCITHASWMWEDDFSLPGFEDAEKVKLLNLKKVEAMQDVMVRCGAAELVVDLIAGLSDGQTSAGDQQTTTSAANSEYVKEEALRFANVLLDGGNREVQDKIYGYLSINSSAAYKFFGGVHGRMIKANRCSVSIRRWIEYKMNGEGEMTAEEKDGIKELSQVKSDLKIDLIFRMLQLLAEGHNSQMQKLLQDQSVLGLTKSRDLVKCGADLIINSAFAVEAVEKMAPEGLAELCQLFDFLTECVQGPCGQNQKLLAQTQISEAVQVIMRVKFSNRHISTSSSDGDDKDHQEPLNEKQLNQKNRLIRKLVLSAVKTLNSMVEGREEDESCLVHSYLCQKLKPHFMIERAVIAYQSHKECKRFANSGLVGNLRVVGLHSLPFIKFFLGAVERMAQNQKIKDIKAFYKEQSENSFMIGIEIIMLMIRLSHIDPKFDPVISADTSSVSSQTSEGFVSSFFDSIFGEHVSVGDDDDDEEDVVLLAKETGNIQGHDAGLGMDGGGNAIDDVKSKRQHQLKLKKLYVQKKALSFFRQKLQSVEVCWGSGGLSTVYFPIPEEGAHMSGEIVDDLNSRLDYGSEERVKELMKMVPEVYDELKWHQTLEHFGIPQKQSTNQLNNVTFLISLIINFLMLISLKYETGENSPSYSDSQLADYTHFFGLINSGLALAKLIHIATFKLPVQYKKMVRVRKRAKFFGGATFSEKRSAFLSSLTKPIGLNLLIFFASYIARIAYGDDVFTDGGFPYYALWSSYGLNAYVALSSINKVSVSVGYSTRFLFWYSFVWKVQTIMGFYGIMFVSAILGTKYSETYPLFYAIQLFTIVPMSPTLNAVMKSVTIPGNQLLMTAVLGLIIIYAFSLLGFFFFHTTGEMVTGDDGDTYDECSNMIDCYKSFVRNGLMYGGGIGDYISGDLENIPQMQDNLHYWSRLIFDLSFFIIIIVLLLNIIFGIILDTFSALREQQNERKELSSNRCFICGLSRDSFEDMKQMGGKGFAYHNASEHNIFDYIYFQIYLANKNDTEFNGAETFVNECVQKEDTIWIPEGQALQIPRVDANAEREKKLEDLFKAMNERQISTKDSIAAEISKMASSVDRQMGMFRKQISSLKGEVKGLKGELEERDKK